MRSEVIDKILSVEDQAETIRNKGEEDARQMVLDAQSEAAKIVKSALEEERRRGDEVVSQASSVLDVKLDEIERKSQLVSSSDAVVDPESVRIATERIARLVCAVPMFGDEA